MEKITINQMLRHSIDQYGLEAALSSKVDKTYQDISYEELGESVKRFGLGLIELGVRKGDRIALLAENRLKLATFCSSNKILFSSSTVEKISCPRPILTSSDSSKIRA